MTAPTENPTANRTGQPESQNTPAIKREALPPAKPLRPKVTHFHEDKGRSLGETVTQALPMHRDLIKDPPVSINGLLLMALGTVCIALSAFLILPLPDWTTLNAVPIDAETLPGEPYSLLLPMALLISGLLGASLGTGSILLYLVAGLFFMPLFAAGGGLGYMAQPGAGYLVGLLAGSLVCGAGIRWPLKETNPLLHALKTLAVTAVSVGVVHGFGLLGLGLQVALSSQSWPYWVHWAWQLGGAVLPYDLALSFFTLWLVRPLRALLWLALY